jgi:hypothetical protein
MKSLRGRRDQGPIMQSWVRYSVAAYLGLMLAGTLITPKQPPPVRFASAQRESHVERHWPRVSKTRQLPASIEQVGNTPQRAPQKLDWVERPA